MPKSKEIISTSEDSDSGSDEEPKKKKKKRDKAEKKKAAKACSSKEKDDDDGKISLGSKKFVTVSEFRGKAYVNIREYYEKDGDMLPGKKGIALNEEQWKKLKKSIPKIDEAFEDL